MLSTVCYEKMCGETAKRMCAALGSSRGTVQKIEAELCKSAPTYRTTEINSLYTENRQKRETKNDAKSEKK